MSQTDRQTDKFTHFKSAIFDVDDNWAKLEVLPEFVKTVFKQQEVCPTTQNLHFQVHIVAHRQVRLSQMYGWIAKTKWIGISAKEKDHIRNSINYCSKKETAVPGTHEVVQGQKYYQIHELLLEVARQHTVEDDNLPTDFASQGDWLNRRTWGLLSSRLVAKDLTWANKLANPALEKCWRLWGEVFLRKAKEGSGASIIEGPASEGTPEEN